MDLYFPKSSKTILPRLPLKPTSQKGQLCKSARESTIQRDQRSTSENRTNFTTNYIAKNRLNEFLRNTYISNADRLLIEEQLKKNEKIVDIIIEDNRASHKPFLQRINFKEFPKLPSQRVEESRPQTSSSARSDVDLLQDNDLQQSNQMEDYDDYYDSESDTSKKMTKEIQYEILNIKHRINKELRESFFRYIKQQDKIKDIAQHFSTRRESLNPAYFFSSQDQLFPKRMDLSTFLNDRQQMNISDLGMSDKYLPLIRNLLTSTKCQKLKQIFLSNNRLDEFKLSIFIDSFPKSLKVLNLQNNDLGKKGVVLLTSYFPKWINLKSLNLQNNSLSDIGVGILLQALQQNQVLAKLNLSENNISDSIAPTLFQFLNQNCSVEVLHLSWNQLGPSSGIMIAKGLLQNRYKKHTTYKLDILRLGQNDKSTACIQAWCAAILQTSFSIIHLDLSYNQFSEKQLRMLNTALVKNNQIYGLHIEGNKAPAYVDPNGFIIFESESDKIEQIQRQKPQINGVSYIPIQNEQQLIGKDCCWICQGWTEHRFIYVPPTENEQVPIFLHLDFLNYKPLPMTTSFELKKQFQLQHKSKISLLGITTGEIIHQLKNIVQSDKKITMAAIEEAYKEEKTKPKSEQILIEEFNKFYYTTHQMCPPRRTINYFFSNPIREEFFIDSSALSIKTPIDNLILQGKDPKFQYHEYADGTVIPFKKLEYVNQLITKQDYVIDDKNDYQPLIKIFPRSTEKAYMLRRFGNTQIRKKQNIVVWNKSDSIFRQYLGDSEQILRDCFEFDWNCSKITKFIKNEYEKSKLKEYFFNDYQSVKDLYKIYSSLGYNPPEFEYFCIPFQQFTKLVQNLNILDGEGLKNSDIELDLISIKNNIDQKIIYNPDKAIIRYQFLEILFRIANDKYMRTGICKNYADAVFRLLKDIQPYYKLFDNLQEWREKRFWTKESDQLLTFKNSFIKRLYEYGTEVAKRKWYFKLKWITIKEFQEFCKQCSLNDYLTDQQQVIIYNFSMLTQIDEVSQDRNIRMSQIEFVEALARMAEYISPAPVGEITVDDQKQQMWDYATRSNLPLHVKLESLLTHIFFKMRKRNFEFEQYSDLFSDLQAYEYQLVLPFMPKTKRREDNIFQETSHLTLFNTVSYMKQNQKPYIHPNYKQFLSQPFNLSQPIFGSTQPLIQPRKVRESTRKKA